MRSGKLVCPVKFSNLQISKIKKKKKAVYPSGSVALPYYMH